jgi:anti-anti-sigma factor
MTDAVPRLSISADGSTVIVDGEVDAHTCPELTSALDPLPGSGNVHVDLSAVGFMDSSGLRALIAAHRTAAEADRQLVIVNPSNAVLRLIEISGLRDHLHVAN